MIIIGFLLDFFIKLFYPFNTYFIAAFIDKNKIFNIILVGLILDVLYRSFGIYLCMLLCFYFVFKQFKVKKKYYIYLVILEYIIFFNVTYLIFGYINDYYFRDLIIGFILYLFYLKIIKVFFN